MHELGHNLGLRHGGVDNVNCKPHHVSVMNYAYQFPNSVPDRPLNYSPLLGVAAPLTCSTPNATGTRPQRGLSRRGASACGLLYTGKIAFGPLVGVPPKPTLVTAGGAINWDKDTNSVEHGHFSRPHRHDRLQRRLPDVNHQGVPRGLRRLGDRPAQPAGLDGLRSTA